MMDVGDVVNMTSWTHYQPNIQASYRAPKGRVGVFLLLGDADKKSPDSFDCAAAINNLGWFPKEDPAPTPPQPIYDEAKRIAELERALAGMLFAFDDGVGLDWSEDLLDFARKLTPAAEFNSRAKAVEVGHE